jgi:hypothetical protein
MGSRSAFCQRRPLATKAETGDRATHSFDGHGDSLAATGATWDCSIGLSGALPIEPCAVAQQNLR